VHGIADGEALDAITDLGNPAGELAAGRERNRDRHLVAVCDEQQIGEVDGGGGDGDAHSARSERGR